MRSEWSWVILGYGTAYGAVLVYLLRLRQRAAALRRRSERLR